MTSDPNRPPRLDAPELAAKRSRTWLIGVASVVLAIVTLTGLSRIDRWFEPVPQISGELAEPGTESEPIASVGSAETIAARTQEISEAVRGLARGEAGRRPRQVAPARIAQPGGHLVPCCAGLYGSLP